MPGDCHFLERDRIQLSASRVWRSILAAVRIQFCVLRRGPRIFPDDLSDERQSLAGRGRADRPAGRGGIHMKIRALLASLIFACLAAPALAVEVKQTVWGFDGQVVAQR